MPLDCLQLHGAETPARVAEIKARTGRTVIKALKIAQAADLVPIPGYAAVADMLLFDAKPPPDPGLLPGGNGLAFDWRLLQDLQVGRPWLLSGGLSADNLAAAVRFMRCPRRRRLLGRRAAARQEGPRPDQTFPRGRGHARPAGRMTFLR